MNAREAARAAAARLPARRPVAAAVGASVPNWTVRESTLREVAQREADMRERLTAPDFVAWLDGLMASDAWARGEALAAEGRAAAARG